MCSPWRIRLTHTQLDFHLIPAVVRRIAASRNATGIRVMATSPGTVLPTACAKSLGGAKTERLVGSFLGELFSEVIKHALLRSRRLAAGGRAVSAFSVRCVCSCRPFCPGFRFDWLRHHSRPNPPSRQRAHPARATRSHEAAPRCRSGYDPAGRTRETGAQTRAFCRRARRRPQPLAPRQVPRIVCPSPSAGSSTGRPAS